MNICFNNNEANIQISNNKDIAKIAYVVRAKKSKKISLRPISRTKYFNSWFNDARVSRNQLITLYTQPDFVFKSASLEDVPKILHNMIRHTLLPRCGSFDVVSDTDLCIIYHLMTKTKLNLCFIIIQHMIDSCLAIKHSVAGLPYRMHMTPIFKKANVSLEGEESKYDFMRFTAKNLGQLHITTSNMPTPPTSGTSGFVKRHADQKVQKTRKKRKVEKVRNLSSIQKEKEDGSPKDADDQAHYPPAMKLFSQVVELARKIVQNVVDEEQFQKEDEVVQERNVQNEAMMVASVTEDDA